MNDADRVLVCAGHLLPANIFHRLLRYVDVEVFSESITHPSPPGIGMNFNIFGVKRRGELFFWELILPVMVRASESAPSSRHLAVAFLTGPDHDLCLLGSHRPHGALP